MMTNTHDKHGKFRFFEQPFSGNDVIHFLHIEWLVFRIWIANFHRYNTIARIPPYIENNTHSRHVRKISTESQFHVRFYRNFQSLFYFFSRRFYDK